MILTWDHIGHTWNWFVITRLSIIDLVMDRFDKIKVEMDNNQVITVFYSTPKVFFDHLDPVHWE